MLARERPLTHQLLGDVFPNVIVANGSAVLWELRSLFPSLEDALPANYRMREVQGHVFEVPWPDAAGAVRVVACPHLSGSFGLSQNLLVTLGEAVRKATG